MWALISGGFSKRDTLKYSTLAILSVFFVEVFLGLVTGSLAILSDGMHALFDALSSFVLYISVSISLKPPDEEHMYGHEKFEPLGGLIGGFTLMFLAGIISVEAISKIIRSEPSINLDFSLAGFIALSYTLFIDLLRMFIFKSTFKNGRSPTIKAGFYHAFSDLGSTLIALLGYWLSIDGIFYGDSLAALTLSALLIFLSVRLVWNNIVELSDTAPKEVVTKVKEEISKVSKGLFAYENLKVRRIGEKTFVRATFRVPDYMSLDEAHDITAKIENNIVKALGNVDVSFHIEPTGIRGMATEEFIEEIVGRIGGVIGVHDINITHHNGRVYVTLHVQVEPTMPLGEAHTLAEKIEEIISKNVSNIGNVLVHIEPSNIELKKGCIINDREINDLVKMAAEKYGNNLRIKRVVTYIANGKRYLGIECISEREIPVEEAHRISSEIENAIMEKISNITVTVHMEASRSIAGKN
jgi:cation diffusion facilitator family transporter